MNLQYELVCMIIHREQEIHPNNNQQLMRTLFSNLNFIRTESLLYWNTLFEE